MNSNLILHIENELDDVFIVQRALKKAGIENPVHHLENGERAVDYFSNFWTSGNPLPKPLPALVLLDLSMPRMDGIEVLKWIRAQPAIKRVIIVVLTSSQNARDVALAYDHGANGYLVKPVGMPQFQSTFAALKSFWLETNHPPDFIEE